MGQSHGKQSLCMITQLPDDLLCLIYKKLDEPRYQKSFRGTCHRFLDIAILSCKLLEVTSSTRLSKSYNLDSVILGKYFNRFRLYESPTYISILHLCNCAVTDNELETLTKYCKSIISVSLSKCSNITNTGIWFLNQNCHKLRALKLMECYKVVAVTYAFSETLSYLQAACHVFYPIGFLSGGGLEYLDIYCSSIRYVDTFECVEDGLTAIGSGIAKNLKILSLRGCDFVTDDCIIKISKGCPLLQELNVRHCCGITLPGWESIGLHCQYLERLHVNHCKNLCDTGLLALGNGCKLLSVLYMSGCPQITSSGKINFEIQRPDVLILKEIGYIHFPKWTYNWQEVTS